MKQMRSKKLLGFIFGIILVLALATVILTQVTTNVFVLLSVEVIEFIIFTIMLFYFFDKYVKPIEKVSKTMDKLLQGNYHARINQQMYGTVGELSIKINALARNLSELTISEQIKAEQLSTVIEHTESGLVLVDEKGYIHVVNKKFISIFGKTTKDYLGHVYHDAINSEEVHDAIQETFLYEKRVKKMFKIKNEDEKVYLEIVCAPLFNERKMLNGAVLVIYDISEFKHLERMRKDFVANVSHELQTPITSIKGFAETLLDGALQDKEASEEFLNIIYNESNRVQLLVEDLLILSQLEKEESPLELTNVSVDELTSAVTPVIKQKANKKGIAFDIQTDDGLTLFIDKSKIQQVLLNLLTNAVSYTPENGKVKLEIRESETNITIRVTDTGIGMSKLILPRIFERFYRVDKDRSRDTGGTGLGLAIVKHIVEVHHGDIEVESEIEKGTCFTIRLPKSV